MIHVRLNVPVRHIRTDNGTEFVNQTLRDYYKEVGISYETSVARSPQQNRVVERLRRIRIDNGTEFVNQTLRDYYEEVGIYHETLVACSPQQNGVVERRNRTLIEAARTMLIYAQALLFLWAEAVATACFTQNRSIIRLRHGKTPYELLHTMASEHRSSGPALNEMTPGTISSRLMRTSSPSTSYVPHSRNDWDLLFQMMFDELLNPPPSVVNQAPEVIAPIAEAIALIVEVIPPVNADSTGSPSSTTVEQDAPSTNSKTYKEALTQSCWIEAMQEELNEFKRLEVWELVPRPDQGRRNIGATMPKP
nr:hypothetical protein [Tanacetum cinerariifolium]